jgi:hypothetical protein
LKIDMHYCATNALARCAGFSPSAANSMAAAAQYVDDSVTSVVETAVEGAKIQVVETAHTTTDALNANPDDQRLTWLPFHFMPAGEGSSFMEQLVCRADSDNMQAVTNHYDLTRPIGPFTLELMGVLAHCFMDTFSHQGFSGVSSPLNKVEATSIVIHNPDPTLKDMLGSKLGDFFFKYGEQGGLLPELRAVISTGAEIATGAVGHGAVGMYPDYPYLKWEYTYQGSGQKVVRDNPAIFMQACQALYEMFCRFLRTHPEFGAGGIQVPFSQIERAVKDLLTLEKSTDERCQAWSDALKTGSLGPADPQGIPPYPGKAWDATRDSFSELANPAAIIGEGVYRLYQAASYHRHFVLRELLPANGMVVV